MLAPDLYIYHCMISYIHVAIVIDYRYLIVLKDYIAIKKLTIFIKTNIHLVYVEAT